jgi:hypothetical protein
MTKEAKSRQKEKQREYDQLENKALLCASSALITEIQDKKEVIKTLKLQYQEEYNKLHYSQSHGLTNHETQ